VLTLTIRHCFPVMLFITPYKVALALKSVDVIQAMNSDHSNESY